MKHQLQNSNSVSRQGEYKQAGSRIEIFPKIDGHKQILPVIASSCQTCSNHNFFPNRKFQLLLERIYRFNGPHHL